MVGSCGGALCCRLEGVAVASASDACAAATSGGTRKGTQGGPGHRRDSGCHHPLRGGTDKTHRKRQVAVRDDYRLVAEGGDLFGPLANPDSTGQGFGHEALPRGRLDPAATTSGANNTIKSRFHDTLWMVDAGLVAQSRNGSRPRFGNSPMLAGSGLQPDLAWRYTACRHPPASGRTSTNRMPWRPKKSSPSCRRVSASPQPAPGSRTIRARQTCFRTLRGLLATSSRRARRVRKPDLLPCRSPAHRSVPACHVPRDGGSRRRPWAGKEGKPLFLTDH